MIDICFSSSIKEGRFGGILIRALERETDGQQFGGPLICKDEVLNSVLGKCIVKVCDKELSHQISKVTQRKGFKGPKGSKDIYWDKKYRFEKKKKKHVIYDFNLRGLSPLFLLLISSSSLLTTFNRKFWELREKTYTFANESY